MPTTHLTRADADFTVHGSDFSDTQLCVKRAPCLVEWRAQTAQFALDYP